MSAHSLLARLRQRGVAVSLSLRVDAPAGALDDRDRHQLAASRDELVWLLARSLTSREPAPPLPGPGFDARLERLGDNWRLVDADGSPVLAGLFVGPEQARSWARGRGWKVEEAGTA